jgi:hypothetical protein
MKKLVVLALFALVMATVAGFKIGGNASPAVASMQRSAVLLSSSTPSPAPATHPWQARMLVLKVCENYGVNNIGGNNGSYCMHMEVPIKYNGTRVEVTAVPPNGSKNHWWNNGQQRNFTGGLCFASAIPESEIPDPGPLAAVGTDQIQAEWCGLSAKPWQDGWNFSGPSFPVQMQTFGAVDWEPVKIQQVPGCYVEGGFDVNCPAQVSVNGPKQGVKAIYLGMGIESDQPFNTPDPGNWIFGYPTLTNYPWMRGVINANGTMSCTTQADPAAKWIDPSSDSTRGSCPGAVWGSNPVTLGPKPTPPKPTPPKPTPLPPPNPPADAVTAWKATANDASNTVGAALRGVASDLPSSDTTQIAELDQLATIPLGDLDEDPPPQAAEGQADITALNNFFSTPGLMPGEGPDTGPATAPAPTPSSTPSPAGPPAGALAAWQATANDPPASLNTALTGVASDLPRSDTTQTAELGQLASLPTTGDTPTQTAEEQADVTALDKFFNTPGFQPNL